jgi:3-isopropylmalate dehydrogenase
MNARIVLLPGDGIGPEVIAEAVKVMNAVAELYGHGFEFDEELIGGAAIDATGDPLPDRALAACREADGALMGAVGGPKWSDPSAPVRPEQGLLGIRQGLGLYATRNGIRNAELEKAMRHIRKTYRRKLYGLSLKKLFKSL